MDIDIVIIGINAELTLKECLESVQESLYTQGVIHIYYVDGGSSDQSVQIAEAFPDVHVIRVENPNPTPGRGRNQGWKKGSSPLVQFIDSDTLLDPQWLTKAVEVLKQDNIVAVKGKRTELHPQRTIYNWIADQEWNDPPGLCDTFGGDVLIYRKTLEETGGYNEELVAGEDPELSWRIQEKGGKILQVDIPMTQHDMGMRNLHQYCRRAFRTGYGFAAAHALHPQKWKSEVRRILLRGGGFLFLTYLGVFFGIFWFIPAFLLLLYPRIFKVREFVKCKHFSYPEAKAYAWHCSWVVLPQFFGVIRYYLGALLGQPLRNQARGLSTRSSEQKK